MPEVINPADFPWRGRCSQCGKASTTMIIRETARGGHVGVEWCDAHAPDVWQMVEKRRRDAEKARYRAEAAKWTRTEYSDWHPAN
jgi:hypothetical protein